MEGDEVLRRIVEWADRLNDDELERALRFLSEEYRMRLRRAAQGLALTLSAGDEVENLTSSRRLPAGARGRVVRLGPSRIRVDFGEHGTWSMLANSLAKVPSPNPQDSASR